MAAGVPFCLAGMLLSWKPPKKINPLYGYRTPRSMKSQKHWDFAQRYSAQWLVYAGAGLIAFSMVDAVVPAQDKVLQYALAIPAVVVAVAVVFIKTERALKQIS